MFAFLAFFAHQPISELQKLSSRELNLFFQEVADLVKATPPVRIG